MSRGDSIARSAQLDNLRLTHDSMPMEAANGIEMTI
jgi:hypothetical protein